MQSLSTMVESCWFSSQRLTTLKRRNTATTWDNDWSWKCSICSSKSLIRSWTQSFWWPNGTKLYSNIKMHKETFREALRVCAPPYALLHLHQWSIMTPGLTSPVQTLYYCNILLGSCYSLSTVALAHPLSMETLTSGCIWGWPAAYIKSFFWNSTARSCFFKVSTMDDSCSIPCL